MPEAQHIPEPGQPPVAPTRRRSRRRRRRPWLVRYWWTLPIALIALVGPWIWRHMSAPLILFQHDPLPGYISDPSRLKQEYRQFTGKPLENSSALRLFDEANKLMLMGNYPNASIILENVAKEIPVPAVFNDLGVLYAKINDGPHATRAFRDALARDHDYPPVRANIKNMKLSATIDPANSELEPNDNELNANAIWLDRPVLGEISQSGGDLDCYWFITPKPPRDRISIEVINRSATLIPHLRVYDGDGKPLGGLREAAGPGSSLRYNFSPPVNSLYSVQVEGSAGSGGAYTLSVSSLRAYDGYEPNDDILNTHRLSLGQSIEANIMDGDDTDFFSFSSPAAGPVHVDIASRDATLMLGLNTFATDLQINGFAPDGEAGAPLHHIMTVEANKIYYLQVFGANKTSGAYSLTVK